MGKKGLKHHDSWALLVIGCWEFSNTWWQCSYPGYFGFSFLQQEELKHVIHLYACQILFGLHCQSDFKVATLSDWRTMLLKNNFRYLKLESLKINIPFTLLHIVCAVVSPTGSRPPSRNRNNEMPGDEELGFEAAVAALGEFILVPFFFFSLDQI